MSGQKLNNLRKGWTQQNLNGLLITLPANISYLTDYTSRHSWFLISKKENVYLTDSRYIEEAKNNLGKLFSIRQVNESLFNTIDCLCKNLNIKNLGFEERYLSVYEYQKLREKLGPTTQLIPTQGLVEKLREIKSPEEINKIREATRITISALKFIKNFISPGARETEIAGELQRFIRYAGGIDVSFDIIVASGPNSSYPHHKTSRRKIGNNEPVLIDIGVDYFGYKSDLTRVFFSGKINSLIRRVYNIVVKAQDKAINKIKPHVLINKIDRAARQYITRKGYGGFFNHNLGHGVGLEVHEAPRISPKENKELKEGMVFTIEPAIYLPGKFGIRLEDIVLVTKNNAEVISGALDK